jgi:hypothetical protein
VSSNTALGEVYSIHHYVIKFVSDLRQSVGYAVSSTNKTDHHDTTEILLKVALHTVALSTRPLRVSYCPFFFGHAWSVLLPVYDF